jgi:hypothetical protein
MEATFGAAGIVMLALGFTTLLVVIFALLVFNYVLNKD